MSIEAKAKAEAKRLMAEVSQLQAQVDSQNAINKVKTQKLISKINQLQVAAIKDRDKNKSREAKESTQCLFNEQATHVQHKQQQTREQFNRLTLAKQKFDVIRANVAKLDPEDAKMQQKLLGLIKLKKEEYLHLNREASVIKQKAAQKGIVLEQNKPSSPPSTSTQKEQDSSVAERAKAEAKKLISEVTQQKHGATTNKTEEVGRMIAEINRLQMAADQGQLTDEENDQLESRIRKIENKQRESREQINQLTEAKIRYELALNRSQAVRDKERDRREQDEKLRSELNSLIGDKENEQRQLMEELEMIRMRSEQESALLKAQRDAARALADQQQINNDLEDDDDKSGHGKMIGVIGLVVILMSAAAAYFLTPWFQPQEKTPQIVKAEPRLTYRPNQALPKKVAPPLAVTKKRVKKISYLRRFRDFLTSGGQGPEMLKLPAGSFMMGNFAHSTYFDERPQFKVKLKSFSISQYEITFNEYRKFARATDRKVPSDNAWGMGKQPVINVSWNDAAAFTHWLSRETGHKYRLPSEREWEYAARAGTTEKFWWGDDLELKRTNCGVCKTEWSMRQPAPVGQFPPNPLGLHDTMGNVLEWTQTCYHKNYKNAPETGQIWEAKGNCRYMMVRGGAYNSYKRDMRVTRRKKFSPKSRDTNIGFRVIRID